MAIVTAILLAAMFTMPGCGLYAGGEKADPSFTGANEASQLEDQIWEGDVEDEVFDPDTLAESGVGLPSSDELFEQLAITEDYRPVFDHGPKGAEFQKYIVLHDTEGDANGSSVVNWWESNGNRIAAHFVINKDGTIVQCVPLDRIAHHAGFGDAGHNAAFGVEDESRDDKLGTKPIGAWAPDYGMNSYSVGIEMVHVGGSGSYPEAQLEALDDLIAYIDAYYGFESEIIDHKSWRTGNSDTSAEFAPYFENYKAYRTHDGL